MTWTGQQDAVSQELIAAQDRIAELERELNRANIVAGNNRECQYQQLLMRHRQSGGAEPIENSSLAYLDSAEHNVTTEEFASDSSQTDFSQQSFYHRLSRLVSTPCLEPLSPATQHFSVWPIGAGLLRVIEHSGQEVAMVQMPEGRIAYQTILGRDVTATLIGSSADDAALVKAGIHPDDFRSVRRFCRDCITKGSGKVRYHVKAQEDSTVTLEVNAQSISPFGDGTSYLLLLARNISRQEQRQHQLEERCALAKRESRAKSEFLANMSHEIRTPLNGLLGLLDLLGSTSLTKRQKKYIELANNSGDSLFSLINDILDCAKIEAGKYELATAEFNLHQLISETLSVFTAQAGSKAISLNSNIDAGVYEKVWGDKGKLRQILLNLLSNAIKFTMEGSVTLRLTLLPQRADNEAQLLFTVADTGVGIPENEVAQIFQEYTQSSVRATHRPLGTGLGLVIAKKLIEMLGGTLAVDSSVDSGTTVYFTVRLEITGQATGATLSDEMDEENATAYGMMKILLAEDDQVNRLIGGSLLKNMGHQVIYAETGIEVLQVLEKEQDIDCILMDIQMPEMDGIEAASKVISLYRQRGCKPLPIVALTAQAMRGDREKCLAAGMTEYITKPYTQRELGMVLSRLERFAKEEKEEVS